LETLGDFEKWLDLYFTADPHYQGVKKAISRYRVLLCEYEGKGVLNALLVTNHGVMITSAYGSPDYLDLDIFSGMLTAINDFVADTLKQAKADHSGMHYGDYNIHIIRGEYCYLALLFHGDVTDQASRRGRRIVQEIEKRYGEVLPQWDGRTLSFTGLDVYLRKYLIEYEKPGKENAVNS
jgi:hypothetical protein